MRKLLTLLAFFFLATNAAASGKLALHGQSIVVGPPTDFTIYWGAKTLVGNAGQDPFNNLGTGTITCLPESTNYYYSAGLGGIVPKNGASKTYNAVRAAPLPASEDIVCADSGGHTVTVHNVVDRTIAGDYTIRWHDGDTRSSGVSGTAQFTMALSKMVSGEEIVKRRGTTINTTANCNPTSNCTGGTIQNGTTTYSTSCNIGACLTNTAANAKTFRPELGDSTPLIGPFDFAGRGAAGLTVTGFLFDGEAVSFTGNMLTMSGTVSDGYPFGMTFSFITVVGNLADTYAVSRPSGLNSTCLDCYFHIDHSEISFTKYGIQTQQSTGGSSDVFAGSTAPNTGEYYVGYNYIHDTGADNLYQQCPRYFTVENNLFTDKVTAVTVGTAGQSPPYYNPFDSNRQQHADQIQVNMQITSTTVCAYNLYPGIVYRGNMLLRGRGRDSLPFWTAPPFPSPNDYSGNTSLNGGIPTQAKTGPPDPTAALGSAQGLAMTNGNQDCPGLAPPACPSATPARKLVASTTPRTYEAVLDAPIIEDNIIFSEFSAGIIIQAINNGSFQRNVVVSPRVATATNLTTYNGFGSSHITLANVYGTPTIMRNIGGSGSVIGSWGSTTPPLSQVVIAPTASLTTYFQDPTTWGSPRNLTEYKAGYLPVNTSAPQACSGVFAGLFRPDGSAETGSCP